MSKYHDNNNYTDKGQLARKDLHVLMSEYMHGHRHKIQYG